jgi:hypothetical protein
MDVRYAVLSFCPDLTDPDAELHPVAVIGVGDDAFGFFVVRQEPGAVFGKDEVSKSVLNNLPSLLHRQLREGMSEVGPTQFLSWLHDRYRNSLSISAISTEALGLETSLEEAVVSGAVVKPILDLYRRVVSVPAEPPRSRRSLEISDRLIMPSYGVEPFVRRKSVEVHDP